MIAEIEPGKWWAIVAIDEYDYDFEHCEAFGPRSTPDDALELMGQNASNPGGYHVQDHASLDGGTVDAFKRSPKRGGRRPFYRF